MWHDLIKRAISATANNMVLANKQMKNKVQQSQATSSNVTTTTSSTPKTTQKQYTTTPKTTVTNPLKHQLWNLLVPLHPKVQTKIKVGEGVEIKL